MTERSNRKDAIIAAATQLFAEGGYNATSVRQIAERVGVTEAALYYHFRGGKYELLAAVLEKEAPSLMFALEACETAATLEELLTMVLQNVSAQHIREKIMRLRWLVAEFGTLSADERHTVHERHICFHNALAAQISRFVPDRDLADRMAWLVFCTIFGYGQLFYNFEIGDVVDVDRNGIIALLAQMVAAVAAQKTGDSSA